MITILTPSKTMDFTTSAPRFAEFTEPVFSREALLLRNLLSLFTVNQIRDSMSVSEQIARKTNAMYQDKSKKQALWAYCGDVFKGMHAYSLDKHDSDFAQDHILIPSGLYGLLRPYDLISPYRLEMKAKLHTENITDLYHFWNNSLGIYASKHAQGEVLMLSSKEYAKAVRPYLTSSTKVVTPAFIDMKPNGKREQVAIYNKMMRGVMARWIVDNRIDTLDVIQDFEAHGYEFNANESTTEKPIFERKLMKPLVI